MPSLNGIEASAIRAACRIRKLSCSVCTPTKVTCSGIESGSQGLPAQGLRRGRPGARQSAPRPRGSRFSVPQSARYSSRTTCAGCSAPAAKIPTNSSRPASAKSLQLVAEGKSSKEIANLLNLSVLTSVETHRARLMQKLNLRQRPECYPVRCSQGIISSRGRDIPSLRYNIYRTSQHNRAPPSAHLYIWSHSTHGTSVAIPRNILEAT